MKAENPQSQQWFQQHDHSREFFPYFYDVFLYFPGEKRKHSNGHLLAVTPIPPVSAVYSLHRQSYETLLCPNLYCCSELFSRELSVQLNSRPQDSRSKGGPLAVRKRLQMSACPSGLDGVPRHNANRRAAVLTAWACRQGCARDQSGLSRALRL